MGEREFISGSCKWFNKEKGYGFLKMPGDGLDVFVHCNQLRKSGIDMALVEGEKIKFQIEDGPKGKFAVNISKVLEGPSNEILAQAESVTPVAVDNPSLST